MFWPVRGKVNMHPLTEELVKFLYIHRCQMGEGGGAFIVDNAMDAVQSN